MLHYQPPSGKHWADMAAESDEEDGFYEAPKKANKMIVVIDDPTLGTAKPKVESVATFLLEMYVEHPDWALDKHIIASYANVGQNSIGQILKFLVANDRIGMLERQETVDNNGVPISNCFRYYYHKGEAVPTQAIADMPEEHQRQGYLVHGRNSRKTVQSVNSLKGQLNNKFPQVEATKKELSKLEAELRDIQSLPPTAPRNTAQRKLHQVGGFSPRSKQRHQAHPG